MFMPALTTTRWFMALALALAVWSLPAAPVRAQEPPAIDMEVFYDELEGAGRWFNHADYGEVWQPNVDDEDWRPYTRGRWAYTEDHGWTWVSDEPWGWAVYHYGRWALDDEWGWIWIPGFEWAPAWVAWRESEDHVGWAPLPPEAAWDAGRGLSVGTDFYDEPRYAPFWVFVAPAYLMSSHLHRHVAPARTNIGLIGQSRPVTRYDFVERRIFNFGLAPNHVERRYGHAVPTSRLTITPDPGARTAGRVARPDFRVYRPDMAGRPDSGARPQRAAPAAVAPGAPVINPRQHDAQPQVLPGIRPGRGQQPGAVPVQAGGAPQGAPQAPVAPTAQQPQQPQQPADVGPRIFRKSGQSQAPPQVLPAPVIQQPTAQPAAQPVPARAQAPPVTPTVINPAPPVAAQPPPQAQPQPRPQRPPDQQPQQPRPQRSSDQQPQQPRPQIQPPAPAPAQPAAKPQRPPADPSQQPGGPPQDRPSRPPGDPR